MVEYIIGFKIQEANRVDLITTLTWLKDNYGTKVGKCVGDFDIFSAEGYVNEALFTDSITTLMAFDTEYGVKLTHLELLFSMSV